ncbi:MAG: SurA N-terminal domain-containing protein [Spirochaetales bacterium]|nr:SurA N-terminal domain-containing protein [Spirochaetales bacterium]
MKKLLLILSLLTLLSPLFSDDSLYRIQLSDDELKLEWDRFLILGSLQEIEYSEEEKVQLKEQVREGLIMRKLFLVLADLRGITVSEEELDLREAQTRGGYPDDEWIATLEAQLHTPESFRQTMKESILLEKVIQSEVLDKISVSDEEIAAYYEAHPDDFTTDYGLLPLSTVEELIRDGLLARKGQEDTTRFMNELYSRAMFVE